MHHLAVLAAVLSESTLSAIYASVPARVIAIAGMVSVLTQLLKRAFPSIQGVSAMAVNFTLSLSAIFATMDPAQFWTAHTAMQLFDVCAAAAGIHSTARSFRSGAASSPQARATVPILLLLLGSLTCVTGCAIKTAKATAPLPIGAVDSVDASANETLQAAHAFALLVSTDVQSGKITLTAAQRTSVNALNTALNTADDAEIAYHKAGGGSTSVLDASLTAATSALSQVQAALAPSLVK